MMRAVPRPERRDLLLLGAALLAVVGATAHRLDNGFVWDDLTVIVRGDVIHDMANLPEVFTHRTLYVSQGFDAADDAIGVDTYRPITLATFFVDSALSGRRPLAYHLTNLFTHLACVVLVFFLGRRLLDPRRRHLAPLAAAIFGLTPHLAEAHVWIDGRSDLFATLFGVSSLLVYLRGRDAQDAQDARESSAPRPVVLFALSGVLFLLGLLSKEVLLLALPAFALFPRESRQAQESQESQESRKSQEAQEPDDTGAVIEVGAPLSSLPSLSSLRSKASLTSLLPLVAAAVVYLALRVSILSGLRTHSDPKQLLAALVRLPVLLAEGALELTVPMRVYVHSMSEDYRALGLTVVLAIGAVVVVVLLAVFRKRREQPAFAWSVVWYASTLAPAAVIATLVWPGFGRYLYLPFAGLAPGLVDLLGAGFSVLVARRPGIRGALKFAVAAYLLALGLRLALYTTDYHDERTLWGAVVEAAPDRSHGWGYYGATLLEEGDAAEAVPALRRAADLDPSEPRYLSQLGWALLVSGDRQGALDAAATGLHRFQPAGGFHALAAEALFPIRPDLAASHVATCLAEEPGRPDCVEVGQRLGLQ
ncbi:MAG: hypothetical protein DRJ42_04500 [Deltaproteobacteria bacterium]|nr:MAG: hypothetical protein DRJ42_04500 [Deltaproteobacteria bacterium]